LPDAVDPCGERGEFHTCVYDGPIFRQPLLLERGERVRRDNRFEYCDLTLTQLATSVHSPAIPLAQPSNSAAVVVAGDDLAEGHALSHENRLPPALSCAVAQLTGRIVSPAPRTL